MRFCDHLKTNNNYCGMECRLAMPSLRDVFQEIAVCSFLVHEKDILNVCASMKLCPAGSTKPQFQGKQSTAAHKTNMILRN